jgi:hypothetical protein
LLSAHRHHQSILQAHPFCESSIPEKKKKIRTLQTAAKMNPSVVLAVVAGLASVNGYILLQPHGYASFALPHPTVYVQAPILQNSISAEKFSGTFSSSHLAQVSTQKQLILFILENND